LPRLILLGLLVPVPTAGDVVVLKKIEADALPVG
jgi:hypothetical protein